MQEIEIEFKNLLTKEEYEQLLTAFQLKREGAKKQVNYYFETDNFHLKERGSALRIREKNNKYVVTLKQPHEDGLLETHAEISMEECKEALKSANWKIPNTIAIQLQGLNVPIEQLRFRGALTTYRLETDWKNCLLVLDYSMYHNTEDYELELETSEFQYGKDVFHQLLNEHQIVKRETRNKIERFFLAMP